MTDDGGGIVPRDFGTRALEVLGSVLNVGDGLELVSSVIKEVARWRVAQMLVAIGADLADAPPESRDAFRRYVESDAGQSLLSDFATTTARTSSRMSRIALGLLFSRKARDEESDLFARFACEAVEGLSDHLVEVLRELASVCDRARKGEGEFATEELGAPYPVYVLRYGDDGRIGDYKADSVAAAIAQLTSRGILLPDHAAGRFGGTPFLVFGMNEFSWRIAGLLEEARSIDRS